MRKHLVSTDSCEEKGSMKEGLFNGGKSGKDSFRPILTKSVFWQTRYTRNQKTAGFVYIVLKSDQWIQRLKNIELV